MFLDIIVETRDIIETLPVENKSMAVPVVVVVVVAIVVVVLSKMVIKRELNNAKKV